MQTLADISAFESLGSSAGISDISVFNALWKYKDGVRLDADHVVYWANGIGGGEADEDIAKWDAWNQGILDATGGNELVIQPEADDWDAEDDFNDYPDAQFSRVVPCSIWVYVPDEVGRPEWAID